jgi:predicted transport protein
MSTLPPFRVRLRLPSSKQETLTLPRPVTIRALLEAIKPFVDVEVSQIRLKLAYPPKPIDLGTPDQWDRNVSDIGISNGEGLVLTISDSTDIPTPETKSLSEPPVSVQPMRPIVAPFQNPFEGLAAVEKRPLTPSKSSSPAKRVRVNDEPPEIPVDGGTIVLRIMEDDNSCMYIYFQSH